MSTPRYNANKASNMSPKQRENYIGLIASLSSLSPEAKKAALRNKVAAALKKSDQVKLAAGIL